MKIKQLAPGHYSMYCPGCDTIHSFGESWGFNKDFNDKPNVQGSLLTHPNHERKTICHLFIRDGKIEYLSDSTHLLSGKIIDMQDIPEEWFHSDEEDE